MIAWDLLRIDPAFRGRLRAYQLDSVSKLLAQTEGRVAAWSRTTETLHIPSRDHLPGFYLKRYYFPQWSKRFRAALRGTFFGLHRGHAEYLALAALRWRGVAAIRPVAYGCRLVAGFVSVSVLITEETPEARNMTSVAQDGASPLVQSVAARRSATRSLAALVSAMHAADVSHGNLFWRNILHRCTPAGDSEYFLLDAQLAPPLRGFFGAQDWWRGELAQLLVSAMAFTTRSDRLRFARVYFNARRLNAEIKAHVRACTALAETMRLHEERRVRLNACFDGWRARLAEESQTAAHAARGPERAA